MDITQSILYIHPTFKFWVEFKVINDWQWNWDIITWITTDHTQPTQAELDAAWVEVEKKQRLSEIGNRMREINYQILQLGGTAQILDDPILDPIRTEKINTLQSEYNTLKTERDTDFTSDMITDVFNSFFD